MNTELKSMERVIENTKIIKKTFVSAGRTKHKYCLGKSELIYIRQNIFNDGYSAWTSRSDVIPSCNTAGLKYDNLSRIFDLRYTTAYFILHWNRKLPSAVADIVCSYIDYSSLYGNLSHEQSLFRSMGCKLCNKTCFSDRLYEKHTLTKQHKNNLIKNRDLIPLYMRS
jgi:hypothetical protein